MVERIIVFEGLFNSRQGDIISVVSGFEFSDPIKAVILHNETADCMHERHLPTIMNMPLDLGVRGRVVESRIFDTKTTLKIETDMDEEVKAVKMPGIDKSFKGGK